MRLKANAFLIAMLMPFTQGAVAQDDDSATRETVRQEIQSLREGLKDSDAEQQKELMADIEDVLSIIDERLMTLDNRLEEKWETADRLARVQAQTAMASLRRERARVIQWYDRMKDSSGVTWESMKEGFDDAFNDLSDAWQSAEQDVRQAVEKA